MNKSKVKKEIIITIVAGSVLYTLFFFYKQTYESWEKKYTVGILKSKSAGYKSGVSGKYTFYLCDKIYQGSCGVSNYHPKIGRKYIVEIPKDHFDRNMMLFEYLVPDSVNVPCEGWAAIPKEIIDYNHAK